MDILRVGRGKLFRVSTKSIATIAQIKKAGSRRLFINPPGTNQFL